MQRPLVGGLTWLAALAVAVLLIGLAACGGQPSATPAPTPVPSVAGLQFPEDFPDEQKAAVLRVPDPGDSGKPLATLVEARTLTAGELAQELREDAPFAALQAEAVARGFGTITTATDLVYDNGVTVTVAPLDTSTSEVLRFAYRSSEPKAHYQLAELDKVGRRLIVHDENGTVSIDLRTGKSSSVESPTAHHSCRFLHCFDTALAIEMAIPFFGSLVEDTCAGCSAEVALAALTGGSLTEALVCADCAVCFVTATASLSAAAWVCLDDPCDLCMSDSCGESDAPSGSIVCGTPGIFNPDPETGSTAGRYSIEGEAYVCEGITTRMRYYWFGSEIPEYRGTQCEQSGDINPWERCKYGCASPAPNDPVSRTCKPAPLVCDPASCTGTTLDANSQTCSLQTDGTYAVTRQVGARGCIPASYPNEQVCGITGWTTETLSCGACGCADAASCRCLAGQPRGDPWCQRATGSASQYEVVQQKSRCDLVAASGQCLESTETVRIAWCGTAGCSNDGKSCGTVAPTPTPTGTPTATPTTTQCVPADCEREEPAGDKVCRLATVTQPTRQYYCGPVSGTCDSRVYDKVIQFCTGVGCAADGRSCRSSGRGSGCVPSECEQGEQPIGDSRCVFRPDDQKWILERDYRYSACNPAGGGDDASCEQTTITRCEQMCPAGCAADGKSCAGSGGTSCGPSGSVPAAPSEFEVSQRPEGTKFWWRDNATNETGFRIYFGSRSLGEASELLKDVEQANAVGSIIPWKRTGGATCWELYAYNAAGESQPARYCLPE